MNRIVPVDKTKTHRLLKFLQAANKPMTRPEIWQAIKQQKEFGKKKKERR